MMKYLFVPGLALALLVGVLIGRLHSDPAVAAAAGTTPSDGWTIHIDAEQHFGDAHPTEIAHHWCKAVAGGLTECQIYDNDGPDAHLVGAETIVAPAVYKAFSPTEQAMWHYHKTEIPKVHATMPGLTPDQAAKMIAAMSDTYGKIWLLWDPLTNASPIGSPTVVVLK